MQLASPRTRARADLQNGYSILNSSAESLGYECLIGRLIGGKLDGLRWTIYFS